MRPTRAAALMPLATAAKAPMTLGRTVTRRTAATTPRARPKSQLTMAQTSMPMASSAAPTTRQVTALAAVKSAHRCGSARSSSSGLRLSTLGGSGLVQPPSWILLRTIYCLPVTRDRGADPVEYRIERRTETLTTAPRRRGPPTHLVRSNALLDGVPTWVAFPTFDRGLTASFLAGMGWVHIGHTTCVRGGLTACRHASRRRPGR